MLEGGEEGVELGEAGAMGNPESLDDGNLACEGSLTRSGWHNAHKLPYILEISRLLR